MRYLVIMGMLMLSTCSGDDLAFAIGDYGNQDQIVPYQPVYPNDHQYPPEAPKPKEELQILLPPCPITLDRAALTKPIDPHIRYCTLKSKQWED